MKKILNYACSFLCLSLMFGMASCAHEEPPTLSNDNKLYSVKCEETDYYSFSGTTSATSGITATVKLTSNFPAYEIVGCTYNGNECTKGTDDGNAKNYTFTMPACDVEIKAVANWNELLASGSNNFLSFDSSNVYSVQSAKNDASYNNDEDYGSPLVIKYNTNASFMTKANVTYFSTDESILPNDALEQENTLAKDSNSIVGGKVVINRSKASVGTTKLVIRVKSDNRITDDAIIVATLTFTA